MTTEEIIADLRQNGLTSASIYTRMERAANRLEELQDVQDKLEKQEEISRDLYYERGLLQAEVNWFKEQPIERTNIRPEPSRLEIAAMFMAAKWCDTVQTAFHYADELIAAAKEAK